MMEDFIVKKIRNIALLLVLIFAIGTIGYTVLESPRQEISVFDAFYLTVITLTTIGFGEIPGELGMNARILTILLAFGGMGTMLYAVSNITAFFVEGHLRDLLTRRRMHRMIEKLENHYIVCGAGLMARYMGKELKRTRNTFVVVDKDLEDLEKFADEYPELIYLVGDVSDDDMMRKCGIEKAIGMVTAQSTDQDNLFTIITARRLNPDLRIVSIAIAESSIPKLRYAGADAVVSTNFIGSMRMVSELIRPTAVGFLDVMLKDKSQNWRIEEATIGEQSDLVGKTLSDLQLNKEGKILVLAMKHENSEDFKYIPDASRALSPGDTLVVLGSSKQVHDLKMSASANI